MKHPERDLQRAVVILLNRVLPPDAVSTAINPLPLKGARAGAQMKRLGLTAGVPDLMIVHHGFTLWIELKAPGKYATPDQAEVHARLRAAHKYPNQSYSASGTVVVCKTVDEVLLALHSHRMTRAKVAA